MGSHDPAGDLARDAARGLTSEPKQLPPKYFYDARGSELFERITRTPEYYPTRAETWLLERHAEEIMAGVRPSELVEIGSGSSRKTRLLLEAMHRFGGSVYAPIDVSEDALEEAVERLTGAYPWLEVDGVVADFDRDLSELRRRGRRLVAFLGSTIGNFDEHQRVPFLRRVHRLLEPEDAFLLGVDLVKDRRTLEQAYNDAAGITAEFNKNVLRVLNRELDGNLPLDAFRHRAVWDERHQRIEMRLRADRPVDAHLASLGLDVRFEAGEELLTEISCKFTRSGVEDELWRAGFAVSRWYVHAEHAFALVLTRPVATAGTGSEPLPG